MSVRPLAVLLALALAGASAHAADRTRNADKYFAASGSAAGKIRSSSRTAGTPENPDLAVLLATLRARPLPDLYYDRASFPDHVKKLIRMPGIGPELFTAWTEAASDPHLRFSLLVIVNQRLFDGNDKENSSIWMILQEGLRDDFAWCRTEAVWGLGMLGVRDAVEDAIKLLDDDDSNVVHESLNALTRWFGAVSGTDAPTRDGVIEAWKTWWESCLAEKNAVASDFPVLVPYRADDLLEYINGFESTFGRLPHSELELDAYAMRAGLPPIEWSSPYEGHARYIKSPGHHSYTILVFTADGVLRDSRVGYRGGLVFPGPGDVGRAPIGATQLNLIWTAPWESNIAGHAVADALRVVTGAEIAFVNAYALRGNIPAGPITEDDIAGLIPFDGKAVIVTVPGGDLIEIMRRGVDDRWFLYPSGVSASHNHRLGIPDIHLRVTGGGPIEVNRSYRVAVPDYLANGGDGFLWFTKHPRENLSMTIRKALVRYIEMKPNWLPLDLPRVTEF